jgi:hypothetical protein
MSVVVLTTSLAMILAVVLIFIGVILGWTIFVFTSLPELWWRFLERKDNDD